MAAGLAVVDATADAAGDVAVDVAGQVAAQAVHCNAIPLLSTDGPCGFLEC